MPSLTPRVADFASCAGGGARLAGTVASITASCPWPITGKGGKAKLLGGAQQPSRRVVEGRTQDGVLGCFVARCTPWKLTSSSPLLAGAGAAPLPATPGSRMRATSGSVSTSPANSPATAAGTPSTDGVHGPPTPAPTPPSLVPTDRAVAAVRVGPSARSRGLRIAALAHGGGGGGGGRSAGSRVRVGRWHGSLLPPHHTPRPSSAVAEWSGRPPPSASHFSVRERVLSSR